MDKQQRLRRDMIREDPDEFSRVLLKRPLHPKQTEYVRSLAQFKNAAWGRRAGKTTVDAVDVAHWAIKYPKSRQWLLSFSQDQAMIGFGYLEEILRHADLMPLLEKPPLHNPFGEMLFINGSRVHARSLQHGGKFVRGHGGHRVKLDEAGIVPDRTVDEAVLPMLTDTDGQLCKSGTPWGRNHFYRSYMEGMPAAQRPLALPGNFSLHCPSWENPYISAAYIERMRGKMTDLQFRTEYGAEFLDEIGRVFQWAMIQRAYDVPAPCICPVLVGHIYVAGFDIAKHLDWTVGYVLDVTDPANITLVYKERFQKESYEYVVQRIREVCGMYRVAGVVVDATGVGEAVVDQVRGDVPNLEPFLFTADSKNAVINNLKMLMEQNRLHFDFDEDLVAEMQYYSYELSERSDHVLMGTQKEKDDCVTALALACWAFVHNYAEPAIGMI